MRNNRNDRLFANSEDNHLDSLLNQWVKQHQLSTEQSDQIYEQVQLANQEEDEKEWMNERISQILDKITESRNMVHSMTAKILKTVARDGDSHFPRSKSYQAYLRL